MVASVLTRGNIDHHIDIKIQVDMMIIVIIGILIYANLDFSDHAHLHTTYYIVFAAGGKQLKQRRLGKNHTHNTDETLRRLTPHRTRET